MKLLTAKILLPIAAVAAFGGVALYPWQLRVLPERLYPTQKLVVGDGKSGDWRARSLACDESTILVGAPESRTGENSYGAVYFCDCDDATSHKPRRLSADDDASSGDFGAAVAVCGANALVGSPGDNSGGAACGAVYAFEDDGTGGWKQVAKLQASPPATNSRFGTALAMDQNRAVVGAVQKNGSGTAYIFEKDNGGRWRQVAMLTSGTSSDHFGNSVAIAGDLAVVGAQGDSLRPESAGSAYVFHRDPDHGWNNVARLAPRQPLPVNSRFGQTVAISNSDIVAAAPGDGVAYLFQEQSPGNWKEVVRLVPRGRKQPFMFGFAVAIRDGTVAVGSPLENDAAGCVYLFRETAGGEYRDVARLALANAESNTCFGWRVALSRDSLLVATHSSGGTAGKTGAAYRYSLDERDQHFNPKGEPPF